MGVRDALSQRGKDSCPHDYKKEGSSSLVCLEGANGLHGMFVRCAAGGPGFTGVR